jgi:hypothetical protein
VGRGADGQPGEVDSTDDEEHPNPYAYFTRAPLADAALEQEIIELLRDCRAASLIRTGANEVSQLPSICSRGPSRT